MLIDFSPHSLLKIEILKSHGIDVSKEIIENVVRNPDKMEKGYRDRSISQKNFDETRVLRVVHETLLDKLYVVTVYPGRRSRYEKDEI